MDASTMNDQIEFVTDQKNKEICKDLISKIIKNKKMIEEEQVAFEAISIDFSRLK